VRGMRLLYDRRQGINWPGVLLVALGVAAACGLVFFAATSTAAFGPFNVNWDGTSEFRGQVAADTDLTTMVDADRYGSVDANSTVAFVVAPDREYDTADAARIRQFLDDGGTLVVLENFAPAGNALLEDVGATARVDGRLVRDEQEYADAPTMPVATNVTEHPLTGGVDQLTLNYASVVEPGESTVLIRTSEFAYLTEDESVELDDDTELVSAPVATVESVGAGRVVTVSDPSILINVMRDRPDNEQFLRGLYAGADTVLLDRSHADGIPALASAVLLLRRSWLVQAVVGGLGLGLLAWVAEGGGLLSRLRSLAPGARERHAAATAPLSTMSEAERVSYLRERHPDWDEDRIRRVITAFNGGDAKGEGERHS